MSPTCGTIDAITIVGGTYARVRIVCESTGLPRSGKGSGFQSVVSGYIVNLLKMY